MRLASLGIRSDRQSEKAEPMKIQKLLVPVDFSEGSRLALREALGLAAREGAALTVVHAVSQLPAYGLETGFAGGTLVETYEERMRQTAGKELSQLLAEFEQAGSPPTEVTTEIRYGSPGMQISEAIAEHEPDLVVLSTHGRSGISRAVVGSVAESIIRHSPVPVLALRPGLPVSSVDAKCILFTTDGSEGAAQAAPWARGWADACNSELVALWVVEDPVSVPLMDWSLFPEVREETVYQELEALARHTAKESLSQILGDKVEYHVRHGSPSVEISAEAASGKHDLLVMATHGRSGVKRLVLGSVAERVLRETAIPMLLVPMSDSPPG